MRANRTAGPRDDQPQVSLKADWGQGVNTVLPADRLPQFQFTHGLNIELREGYPVTRHGLGRANWLYRNGVRLGEVFQGHGLIQGAEPDPVIRLPLANLLVCDNDLWLCAPNNEPTLLMEDCTEALQEVEIIDAFDEALILRNLNQTPLRYAYRAGQFPRALPAPREGMTTLPPARTGCYAGNRIWLVVGKNEVIASDIFEWDYAALETRWQVDDGEGDEIVRLWPVGENRIVVFKTRSVFVIEGVASLDTASDPPVQVNIYRVAAARGCVAAYAIAQRGQTLFYLGRDGLEALLLSEAAVAAMSDKPLSLAMERYWQQLRWLDVAGARMTIAHGHLLISVPTRWREDESIPSLLLGGEFPEEEEPPFAEVEICGPALTFVTYSGSGTWCGFKGFFTYNEGITPRYLTKTIKGFQQYVNSEYTQPLYPNWETDKDDIQTALRALVAGDEPWTVDDMPDAEDPILRAGFQGLGCIESGWYGEASYNPETGCSLANGLRGWRRTNGWQYASVMQYVTGAALSDDAIPSVDNLFAVPYTGAASQVVTGYNVVLTPSPSERVYRATGTTSLANQLGAHTVFGDVRELLGNEHTLYDQLVIDGALVASTRSSELYSYNDDTGAFSGLLSTFSFTVPDELNVDGVDYVVEFAVTRVTGIVSTSGTTSHAYVGDGVNPRTLTVPLPVEPPGTRVEFSGQCVTVREQHEAWDDLEHLATSGWVDDLGFAPGWSALGEIGCGTVAADVFEVLIPEGSTRVVLNSAYDGGNCWDGNMDIGWMDGEEAHDDFEGYSTSEPLVAMYGGIGWADVGDVGLIDPTVAYDDFEDYAVGAITEFLPLPAWGDLGDFGDLDNEEAHDDFEDYATGPLTSMDQGDGWASAGDLGDI